MLGLAYLHIHPWSWPGAIGITLSRGCIVTWPPQLSPCPFLYSPAPDLMDTSSSVSGRAHTSPLSLGPTHPLLAREARFSFSGKTFIQQPPCSAAAHRPTMAPLTGLLGGGEQASA